MAKPYGYDLRQKVMEAIELDGMPKSEASKIFNISRNTINLWFQRKAETGDMKAKVRQPGGKGGIIKDWERFKAFAVEHSDKTQEEMAELWEGNISGRSISRALQKIGFTRKKRPTDIRNGMKRKDRNFKLP